MRVTKEYLLLVASYPVVFLLRSSQHFKEGDKVCNQGDPGIKLYIVESGTISFLIGGMPVGSQKSGGVFGELR